jgi:hypothetical protein
MSFAKPTPKQEFAFDEIQKLMCSVFGCPNRWSVHMSGDKPKCSKHQWEKNASDYKRPTVAKTVTQTIRHWNETENDGEVF